MPANDRTLSNFRAVGRIQGCDPPNACDRPKHSAEPVHGSALGPILLAGWCFLTVQPAFGPLCATIRLGACQ